MARNSASNRAKIQELLDSNTARAGGDFHSDELNDEAFIIDLKNNFKITSKEEGDPYDKVHELIYTCMRKVRGMMNARELNRTKFLKLLFEQFEIERL